MEKTCLKDIDKNVCEWLSLVRKQILKKMKFEIKIKSKTSNRDLVTNIDKEIELFLINKINKTYKNSKIISEEYNNKINYTKGFVWYIDPIDGTMNFIKQKKNFATMIALYIDGKPILGWIIDINDNIMLHGGYKIGVYKNELLLFKNKDISLKEGILYSSASKLINNEYCLQNIVKSALSYRIYGSAGISFMSVILGYGNAYISYLKPWDYAAGNVLAKYIGLETCFIDDKQSNMISSRAVLVSTKKTFIDIKKILNDK